MKLAELGEEYFDTQHTYDPYNATLLGLSEFENMAGDPSVDASEVAAESLAQIGHAVSALDVTALDQAERIDHAVLTALVSGAQQDAAHSLWAANASAKGYVSRQALIFQAIPAMTIADPAGDSYLERISGLGNFIAALGVRYTREASRGRRSTQLGILGSIDQLEGYLALGIDKDPLLKPAEGNEAVTERARLMVADTVRPAVAELAALLRNELLATSRPDGEVGIQNVAGGEEGYLASVARHTTTDLTPDEIHRIGLDTLAVIRAELRSLGQRAFGVGDFETIVKRMRTDPALRFSTSAEIVGVAQAALDRADAARSEYFLNYDITACVIEEVNAAEADNSPLAYYRPPAADGSRPGAHCLVSTKPETRFRFEYEALAFHESVPGHHLQLAMAQRLDIPRYRRHLDVEACSFNEGWGLYAEEFADEIGLYSDDLSRMGMLSMRALRACRLVIDTGIHHLGWSRSQAVEFMWNNTATTESNARSEVDRYIAWPGQALSYLIGSREIHLLREQSKAALGTHFSLAEFHDTVLGNGAVPLSVLARNVEAWRAATLLNSVNRKEATWTS